MVGQGVLEEQLGGEGVASWALRSGKNLSGLLAECQLENLKREEVRSGANQGTVGRNVHM